MTTEHSVVVREERDVALSFAVPLVERALATGSEIAKVFRERMKEKTHYMHFSGGSKPGLMDPGATMIQEGFNVYPIHKILEHFEDSEGHVRYVVQATLIHRSSNMTVAGGVGSATSRETKYAYRWVKEEDLPKGIDPETCKQREVGDGLILYRISNPELGDLENTLIKMAAKRAEIDATLHLPGAGEIFTQDVKPAATRDDAGTHFCQVHKVPFFKKGNMRGYAHPIEGTKEWCNEDAQKPPEAPQTGEKPVTPQSQAEPEKPPTAQPEPQGPAVVGTLAWVIQKLPVVRWTEKTLVSWVNTQILTRANQPPLAPAVKAPQVWQVLSEEQRATLVEHIRSMVEASGG